MLRHFASVLVFVLAACGGGDPAPQLDESVSKALTASVTGLAKPCLTQVEYAAMIERGMFLPLPLEIPSGSIWHAPFLLVPATGAPPKEVAPGLVGTLVEVPGPNGPMNIKGPYYVAGQLPDWVCKP